MKRSPQDHGENMVMTTKRITMEADLAIWIDAESSRLGMPSSAFVITLLEWARDENFAADDALFPGALGYPSLRPLNSVPRRAKMA